MSIDKYINDLKEFIKIKLNNEKFLSNLIDKFQSQEDLIGFYCKEIMEMSELTQNINCSFKSVNGTHFCNLPMKFPEKNTQTIPIFAILSKESLTKTIEHNQHIVAISIDVDKKTFTIADQYTTQKINQYDPIMSKSSQFKGQYLYDPTFISIVKFDKQRIIDWIDLDQLVSIASEIIENFKEQFPSNKSSELKRELIKKFPFFTRKAYEMLANNINHFIYAQITLNDFFEDVMRDALLFQNFKNLQTLFKRLTQSDLDHIKSLSTYKENFIKLVSQTEKGLSYDELMDLMVDKINQNFEDNNLQGFQKQMCSDIIHKLNNKN